MMRGLLFVIAALIAFPALSFGEESPMLKEVPNDKVCMVNDKYMAEDQIAIPFEGRTYYGCCEMCVAKLEGEVAARTALDPHTGEAVDKALAYIVAKPDKKVLYFSSRDNFVEYSKKFTRTGS